MKTRKNSGDISLHNNTDGASKRMGNLNSAVDKADSQSSASDFESNTVTYTLQNHICLMEQFTESQSASWVLQQVLS
jgi:hypothetical protein